MHDALHTAARFDLHMHTNRSDGRFAPDDVLARCARGGLDCVALTDHDLPPDISPGLHEIEGKSLLLLGGAEMSGSYAGREVHLLVYFAGDIPERFRSFCADATAARARRYDQAIANLGLPDLPTSDEAARRGEHALTRYHLAYALVAAGHAKTPWDAFDRLLNAEAGMVPAIEVDLIDALRAAHDVGGVTVWAHPPTEQVKEHAATLAREGLDGLEVLRPRLPSRDRRALRKAARELGLCVTGGSDWHGWTRPDDLGLFAVHRSELVSFFGALQSAS